MPEYRVQGYDLLSASFMEPVQKKFICWRCRASYVSDMKFCGKCGADMHRASRLRRETEAAGSQASVSLSDDDGEQARRSSDFDPWIGKVIDNRYRIVEQLGQGGMGVVYRVEHQRMGKIAALKMLHADLARDKEVQERFHREAEAVSRLNHHNTVQVFDFGVADGMLYLVMEYVHGVDVGELVDRDGPISFVEAAPLFAQTCASLIEAHERGIIHRDLKPENIVVTRTSRGRDFVKVLDFGLAKLSEGEELSEVTSRGTVVGTPYYMSPEQIRGDEVDPRSDIYALGALMYKVLTGHPPFEAKNPVGVLTKHLTEDLVPPSERRPDLDIDERVDELLARCLAKEAEDRFQSTAELAEAIERIYSEMDEPSQISQRLYIGSGATRSPRAESVPDVVVALDGYGVIADEDRLRREDIDAFENRLRRRRSTRIVGIPLLLLAAAGGSVYAWYWYGKQPRTMEREPNDTALTATLIAANTTVTARIGKRISDDQGDRDFYLLADKIPTDGTQTLSVHLISQRNIDMRVDLVDASGTSVVGIDGAKVGGDEWLRRYRITSPLRILISEAKTSGFPTESISDSYELELKVAPVDPRLETEPNDLGRDANVLSPGHAVTGFFDSPKDADLYRFEGEGGRYKVLVSGAQGATLLLDGKPFDPDKAKLETGSIISARPGETLVADAPYTIDVAPIGARE